MSVKRWSPRIHIAGNGGMRGTMDKKGNGAYVLHTDYADLEGRCRELEAKLAALQTSPAEPVCEECGMPSAHFTHTYGGSVTYHPFQPKAEPAECQHGCVDGIASRYASPGLVEHYPCPIHGEGCGRVSEACREDHGTHAKKEGSNG